MADVDIQRLAEVMKQIQEHENKNTTKNYQAKKDRLEDFKLTVADLEKHYKQACEKVAKEKADVDKMKEPSTRDFFTDQKSFDDKMSVEQEEYLEALSEQEIAKKNLDGVQEQKKQLEQEVANAAKQSECLLHLYEEQDQMLGKIFNGEYGSDLENKLEAEYDHLLEKKERIQVAKYKWTNAKFLLDHAVKQLGVANARWKPCKEITQNPQAKYTFATEARNNIIASHRNITGAQQYLNNIKFPYCEKPEMDTLMRACENMYIDMQSEDRHRHAGDVFNVTYKRAAALVQWFESVINKTITKDLETAKKDLAPVKKALKDERMRLIREKLGSEADCLELNQMETEDDVVEQELTALAEAEKTEDSQNTLGVDEQAPCAPTPLPLNKLAPPPSQDELFGNIEQLKQQHEKEMAEFDKAQETNKARLQQGLEEKLAARRNRRARIHTD